MFVSISQVIGREDYLRNDPDCVGWSITSNSQVLYLLFFRCNRVSRLHIGLLFICYYDMTILYVSWFSCF